MAHEFVEVSGDEFRRLVSASFETKGKCIGKRVRKGRIGRRRGDKGSLKCVVRESLESEDAFDHVIFVFCVFDNVSDTRLDQRNSSGWRTTDKSDSRHYLYMGLELPAKYTEAIESLELCIYRAEKVRTLCIHERANSCIVDQIPATTQRQHTHPLWQASPTLFPTSPACKLARSP